MIQRFVESLLAWAARRPDVRGVALVGSHARGDARPDSDVDLLLLTERPHELIRDAEWARGFGHVSRVAVEDWGRVTSLRVWYAAGLEVEFGLATLDWASEPDDVARRSGRLQGAARPRRGPRRARGSVGRRR